MLLKKKSYSKQNKVSQTLEIVFVFSYFTKKNRKRLNKPDKLLMCDVCYQNMVCFMLT